MIWRIEKFEDEELEELLNEDPCRALAKLAKSLRVDYNSFKMFESIRNDPKARTLGVV